MDFELDNSSSGWQGLSQPKWNVERDACHMVTEDSTCGVLGNIPGQGNTPLLVP